MKQKEVEDKFLKSFFKKKNFVIIKTNYSTNYGKIEYIVKEKIETKIPDTKIINFANIKEVKYKIRFIIVQKLNIMNYKRELNKKRVSKGYLKKRGAVKNVFTYLAINSVKEEPALDVIQIYLGKDIKKIKYRRNVSNIKNIYKDIPLRNAA